MGCLPKSAPSAPPGGFGDAAHPDLKINVGGRVIRSELRIVKAGINVVPVSNRQGLFRRLKTGTT